MGFEQTYSKRLRLERGLANEFTSCKQFVPDDVSKDKDELRDRVVNLAIKREMSNGLLKTLADLCDDSRLNGCSVSVNISSENWQSLVFLLNKIDKKLDEGDLIQHCLKCYIQEMKMKRSLP
jgi:hypothetical protein